MMGEDNASAQAQHVSVLFIFFFDKIECRRTEQGWAAYVRAMVGVARIAELTASFYHAHILF